MSTQHHVELKSLPSLISLYRKIFFARKPGWDQQMLPNIKVCANGVQVSKSRVAQYAQVCGFNFDGKQLPPTYLYVKVFRLHATVFNHDGITFPLLGMIHLRNSISHYRPVGCEESFNLQVELTDSRVTDSGLEFDLVSRVFVADELVWEAISTYLYRIEKPGRRARPPKASDIDWQQPVSWQLEDDLGRRYAKASGDYNLIHLHPMLSKRFGFDRVLAHGMWSKARCVAELMPSIDNRPVKIDVAFKLPLFMPSEVTFAAQATENGQRFELRDQRGRRPHLTGEVSYL